MLFQLHKIVLIFFLQALNKLEWVDGEPTEAEKEFWELASLDCYNNLSKWKELEYCSTVNIVSENSLDLSKMWSEPFYQVCRIIFVSELVKLKFPKIEIVV
jgi:DNA-dependent protein kinase catalytic subunit